VTRDDDDDDDDDDNNNNNNNNNMKISKCIQMKSNCMQHYET
jgi:hypothetical protein